MPVLISLLRGVNLGSHRRMKMADLRTIYQALGFESVTTLLQSGNVVFKSDESDLRTIAARIEKALEQRFGFHSDVILRTGDDFRAVVRKSPFAGQPGLDPAKLLVTFLRDDPPPEALEHAALRPTSGEEVRLLGRELFIYFPAGLGRSKLQMASVERALKTTGTGRNWNSVTALMDLAETMS